MAVPLLASQPDEVLGESRESGGSLMGSPAAYRPPPSAATKRSWRLRPMAYAATCLVAVALMFWIGSKSPMSLLIAITMLCVVMADGIVSYKSLRDPHLELRNPPDAVTGGHVSYLLQAGNITRPILVLPAGPFRQHAVLVERDGPGLITLPAPPRGVVRYLVLDLVSTTPLGFVETIRRVLVPLPVPMLVAPPLVAHDIDFPDVRPKGFGEIEQSTEGEDVFRGVRDYVRGDSQRKVHWPASAHHRQLMVRETDGTGVVPLRIVVMMRGPGAASEVTAGRAAYLAETSTRRGWSVHLVTVENPGEPVLPTLGRPLVLLPRLLPPPVRLPVTVSRQVKQRRDTSRRLSTAGFGEPTLEPFDGMTRVITTQGDYWL